MKKYKICILFSLVFVCLIMQAGCNNKESNAVGDSSTVNVGSSSQGDRGDEIMNIKAFGEDIGIVKFKYLLLFGGMSGGELYSIGINTNGDVIIDSFNSGLPHMNNNFQMIGDEVNISLTVNQYEELVQLIDQYDLCSWDEVQDDSIVVDGGYFNLTIEWSDGTSVRSYGNLSDTIRPENFNEARQAINDFFSQFNSLAYPSPQSSN